MTRRRLVDLFCRAGGCSVGYHRAGFDVVGVEIDPRPDYPFPIVWDDAMECLRNPAALRQFDVVHASPPCQSYTTMSNRTRGDHPDLLGETLELLAGLDVPWVVENVPGARRHMPGYTITLHGGMFGLGVHRPRIFASNVMLFAPPPCDPPVNPVGVYGKAHDGRRLFTRADGTEQRAAASLEEAQAAMGIDWMTDWRDLAEAIPPAYTEFIGAQLLDHVRAAA